MTHEGTRAGRVSPRLPLHILHYRQHTIAVREWMLRCTAPEMSLAVTFLASRRDPCVPEARVRADVSIDHCNCVSCLRRVQSVNAFIVPVCFVSTVQNDAILSTCSEWVSGFGMVGGCISALTQ